MTLFFSLEKCEPMGFLRLPLRLVVLTSHCLKQQKGNPFFIKQYSCMEGISTPKLSPPWGCQVPVSGLSGNGFSHQSVKWCRKEFKIHGEKEQGRLISLPRTSVRRWICCQGQKKWEFYKETTKNGPAEVEDLGWFCVTGHTNNIVDLGRQ